MRYEEIVATGYGYSRVKLDNKWGLVDSLGLEIIKPEYDGIGDVSNKVQLIIASKGDYKNRKFGVIGFNNEVVIDFEYDWINPDRSLNIYNVK
ncbi:MAG: WG repeat-containing protein, partial [Bacteroidota bacterium]